MFELLDGIHWSRITGVQEAITPLRHCFFLESYYSESYRAGSPTVSVRLNLYKIGTCLHWVAAQALKPESHRFLFSWKNSITLACQCFVKLMRLFCTSSESGVGLFILRDSLIARSKMVSPLLMALQNAVPVSRFNWIMIGSSKLCFKMNTLTMNILYPQNSLETSHWLK